MTHDPHRDLDAAENLQADIADLCIGHPNIVILSALLGAVADLLMAAPHETRDYMRQASIAALNQAVTTERLRYDA
jgi:hypothetical protein